MPPAYAIIGFIVFWVAYSLGEMATYIPVSGMAATTSYDFIYALLTHVQKGLWIFHSVLPEVCGQLFWIRDRIQLLVSELVCNAHPMGCMTHVLQGLLVYYHSSRIHSDSTCHAVLDPSCTRLGM